MPGMEPMKGGMTNGSSEFKPAVPDLSVDQAPLETPKPLENPLVKGTGEPDKIKTDGGGYGEVTPKPEVPKPTTETVTTPPTPPAEPKDPDTQVSAFETNKVTEQPPHGISGFFKKLFGGGKVNQEKIIDTSYHTGEHKIDPERLAKLRQVGGDKGVISSQDRYLNSVPENEDIDKAA